MPRFSVALLLPLTLAITTLSSVAQQPVLTPFYAERMTVATIGGFRKTSESGDLPIRRAVLPEPEPVGFRTPSTAPQPLTESAGGPIVTGSRAVIRRGIAYAPSEAPENVKRAIWAINRIVGSRYKWGGGHASFSDDGYDCSGTVSYALHSAGLLDLPMGSNELTAFGRPGCGRWITVYARHGHVFAEIAGLRLDTTDLRYGGDVGPRWHPDHRDTSDFTARHAVGV